MKQLFLPLFLSLAVGLQAQSSKNVFFVGNSYTAYNNLPQLIKNIAASTNDTLNYTAHTPGGSTFMQHNNNTTVNNNINSGNYDFIVLQEQSQLPSFPQSQVENEVYYNATALVNKIRIANPCTTPIFYMTWGRKNGDTQLCNQGLSTSCTYEKMDSMIALRYTAMAEMNEALLSPVGRVWRTIRTQHPTYELYTADESHPSLLGSMAAAYTFYTIIFKKDPTLANFNSGLTTEQIENIQNIVKTVVYDNLETWFVNINDNPAQFNYSILDEGSMAFENISNYAQDFQWNFGDGNTSTEENPTHTFTANGTYEITLTTQPCNKTITKTIVIDNITPIDVSINELQKSGIKVYPNPASHVLNIEHLANIENVVLYTIEGKIISLPIDFSSNKIQVNISTLSTGIYFLNIVEKEKIHSIKIIKQ